MRYTVCFNTGASVGVEADSFHVVHNGTSPDGSIVVQFMRSVPNPRFVPRNMQVTFGIDAEPEDVADDDWETRNRNVQISTALYTGVTEVLLAE